MKIEHKMKNIIKIFRRDPVLSASIILAVISSFFVKPTQKYFSYIDYSVICILYSLMVVVSGLKCAGVFESCVGMILKKAKNTRVLGAVLIFGCFLSSMLITNDVALITFVPLTIMIFEGERGERFLIPVIVLETVAANLGSQLTPIGNPQNLYIYSLFGIPLFDFLELMLPLTIASFLLIVAGLFFIKKEKIEIERKDADIDTKSAAIWILMFFVCLLSVVHILPHWATFLAVIFVGVVTDRKNLLSADFALLFTFIFFFIFIGNMKNIPSVRQFLEGIIAGQELTCAIFLSQVVSNVPAAMLLSGFTKNFRELLFGVNIGGLGTLIASMASLISYKMYTGTKDSKVGKYALWFTVVNIIFLVILWALAILIV